MTCIGRLAIYIYPEWYTWVEISTGMAKVHDRNFKCESYYETGRYQDYIHPVATG